MLSAAGSLDPGFGVGGLVTTSFGGAGRDSASAVLAQPDGKIVVVGSSLTAFFSSTEIALARYNRDGSLDTTFGSGGKVLTLIGVSDFASSAVIRPDGRILVEAQEELNSTFSFQFENLLVQYNPDGSLDTSFGNGGFVETPQLTGIPSVVQFIGTPNTIALTPAGQAVVVSNQNGFVFRSMDMAKFNADGSLDTSFGNGGIKHVHFLFSSARDGNFGGLYDQIVGNAVTVDSQGRILVAGQSAPDTPFFGFIPPVATLMRFNPDGSLDNTFGVRGANTDVLGRMGFNATSVAVRADGQIFVAGESFGQSILGDVAVEQLNSDGTTNLNFGFDGVTGTVSPIGASPSGISFLAIQSNGDLVVAENTFINPTGLNGMQGMALIRYNPDGSLDQDFGTGGITTTFFPSISGIVGVAISPIGDIFVAGSTLDPVTLSSQFALAAYLRGPGGFNGHLPALATGPVPQPAQTAGGLNPAFGVGGIATSALGLFQDQVATQDDGKILSVGGDGQSIQLIRFNTDGSVDTSFGSGGLVTTQIGGADFFAAEAIEPNGKILVSSIEIDFTTGLSNILLVQYNPDGSLDTSFGTGGSVVTSLPGGQRFNIGYPFLHVGLALGPQDQIVVVGTASGGSGPNALVIAEFNSDGSLNSNFGAGGFVITPTFTDSSGNTFTNPSSNSVIIDRHGRIVIDGTASIPGTFNNTAVLARYNADGSPDLGFGFQGAVTNVFAVPGTNDIAPAAGFSANSVALLPDDGIIVSGNGSVPSFFPSTASGFAVEAFNADGSPDQRFGSQGITIYLPPPGYEAFFNPTGLAVQRNGDVIVAGTTEYSLFFGTGFANPGFTDTHFALIRLTPDGNFDPSFGTGGVVTQTFPNPFGFILPISVALEPDGNIVTGGTEFTTSFTFQFVLAEYLGDPPGPAAPAAAGPQTAAPIALDPAALSAASAAAPAPSSSSGSGTPLFASSSAGNAGSATIAAVEDTWKKAIALAGGSAQQSTGDSVNPLAAAAIDALFASVP